MSRRYTQLVILCEDQQHEVFVRRYLRGIGYSRWELRVVPLPAGKQDAKQYVLERFPVEVRACRNKASYQSVGLVTAIDADMGSVENRFTQLNAHLKENSLKKRWAEYPRKGAGYLRLTKCFNDFTDVLLKQIAKENCRYDNPHKL